MNTTTTFELLQAILQILIFMWPIWLLVGFIVTVRLARKLYLHYRFKKAGLLDIDHLDGFGFEDYLAYLFQRLNYQVTQTPYHGDFGADLILENENERIAVQAKRFSGTVGLNAIQEIVAAKAHYQCNRAMVVTNSYFSKRARELAKTNGVELWDRKKLATVLLSQKPTTQEPEPQNALNDSSLKHYTIVQSPPSPLIQKSAPTVAEMPIPVSKVGAHIPSETASQQAQGDTRCKTCGALVSDKVRDYCLSNQDRFGGDIYCFQHQKAFKNRQSPLSALTSV